MDLLCNALTRFLQDHHHTPATAAALLAQQDWLALRALAHRLGGAAGNLALVPLHRLAQQLEQATDHADSNDVPALVQALSGALLAAQIMLDTTQTSDVAPTTPDHIAPTQLDATQHAQALLTLEQLHNALAHAELPETALQTLTQLLPALALAPLQQAIDHFDFERAQRCLEHLQTQLRSVPAHKEPLG